MYLGRIGWLLLMGAVLSGCSSTRTGPRLLGEVAIEELNLLTMPMGVNLDQNPGADGFAVKIYAISRANPKSVAITSGRLEILMHDGIVPPASVATNTPASKWEFSAEDLAAYAQKTSIGVVYALTPTWGERKPKMEQITVTACYHTTESSPGQNPVCSRPTTVTVALPSTFK